MSQFSPLRPSSPSDLPVLPVHEIPIEILSNACLLIAKLIIKIANS